MAGYTEVAKATVTIIPNMQGSQEKISKDLGASVGNAGNDAGNSFGKKLLGAVGKLGVAAAIGKFIGDSVSKGADLQQSLGGIETLFKENADIVKGYASEAYKTAGLSANDYMESVTSFSASLIKSMDGDTAAAAELANTAMIDMADNANKMGTDMSSIQSAYQGFAKQNYTMLDNLKLGYGGTKSEMERLLADASKLSGVEYNIDNLDDVYNAIHVIQEDLGITGATAAESASTFSGSMASMKAAADNLMGSLAIGDEIGPQIQALGDSVRTFVVDNLLPMIGNVLTQIPTILANLPSFIGDMIPEIITVGAEIVANLAQSIIENIPVFVAGVGSMFGKIWDFVTTINWGDIGSTIVSLIGSAWDALVETAGIIWDGVVSIFSGGIELPDIAGAASLVWSRLKTIAGSIWDAIVETFTSVFDFSSLDEKATAAWSTLITLAGSVWESIKGVLTKLFDFTSLDEKATAAWASLVTLAGNFWTSIKGVFSKADVVFSDLSSLASTAWNTLTSTASTIWDGIKDIFSNFEITWPDFGALAKDALDGLKSAAEGVWNWIKGLFSGDEGNDAVKSVQGSTAEMAATFADAKLQVSEVDMSSIIGANEFVKGSVASWKRMMENVQLKLPAIGTTALTTAYKMVHIFVNSSKGAMNFTWSLPTLHGHLPVIAVNMRTASSSDGRTSVSYPDLFVSGFKWFAQGGIFNDPTIIGIGDSRGPEAAVPLDQMWKRMSAEFDQHLGGGAVVNNYFTVDGAQDPEAWAMGAARAIKRELRMA